jgi:hypothetical protein
MKITTFILEKIYWLCVASIPILPLIVLHTYFSALACSDDGICFQYGHSVLNSEGETITMLAGLLLWPNCAWNLIGKHVWSRIHSANQIEIVK